MEKRTVIVPKGKMEEAFAVAFAPVVALSELIKNASDSCTDKQDIIKIDIDTDQRTIRLRDNGIGFRKRDIENLSSITNSDKMSAGNEKTPLGEYYAGSKGLGILTAFNLCDLLEIKTYSQRDKQAYHLLWEKGTGEFTYEKTAEKFVGTELTLNKVSKENISLIVDDTDELEKLFSSSITYYQDSATLPNIEISKDGKAIHRAPTVKLQKLYKKHKKIGKNTGCFVASANFSYENNKLKISYEENVKQLHNLTDEEIDLGDSKSLEKFLSKEGLTLYKKDEVYKKLNEFKKIELDAFSGEFHVWSGVRAKDLDYPYGVKVFANNYGLYNYLNKNNDWLQLSEISQNRKNTNYKLKNTYGFVHFNHYNENKSALEISNERNDFKVNKSQKKFVFIMQDLLCNIFATIDIEVKNHKDGSIFETKSKMKPFYVDEVYGFRELIDTNQKISNIEFTCANENVEIDQDTGKFLATSPGEFQAAFSHQRQAFDVTFKVEERVPSFELKKHIPPFTYGRSEELKKLIVKSSLKHLSLSEIEVSSEEVLIQKGGVLSPKALPGTYEVKFKCRKFGIDLQEPATIKIKTGHSAEADKINDLFVTAKKYPKINDIIKGIAANHVSNSTFAMLGVRPLIEITLKALIAEFYSGAEQKRIKKYSSFQIKMRLEELFEKLEKNEIQVDSTVLVKYKKNMISNKDDIIAKFKEIDPNKFLHQTHSFSKRKVYNVMEIFELPINFMIEAINSKE